MKFLISHLSLIASLKLLFNNSKNNKTVFFFFFNHKNACIKPKRNMYVLEDILFATSVKSKTKMTYCILN